MAQRIAVLSDTHGLLRPEVLTGGGDNTSFDGSGGSGSNITISGSAEVNAEGGWDKNPGKVPYGSIPE